MKGGLIAGLHAIHAVHEAYGPLRGTVVFESVIEEECSGNGTPAAREHGSTVDAAPIPEITGEASKSRTSACSGSDVAVVGRPGTASASM